MHSFNNTMPAGTSLNQAPQAQFVGNADEQSSRPMGTQRNAGNTGSGLWGQICLLLLLAWGFLCSLHWTNDGLWSQPDSSHHAMNGLFWKDLLQDGWWQPGEYAHRYFARYPMICPTYYPPAFYLAEAAAFELFGPSPFVAKGLVLAFALLAGIYTLAWLRRWIDPAAGAAAGLVLLMPGIVRWSHAVMLDVPAMALGMGALHHCRRALETSEDSGSFRQLAISAALATLGILTHPLIGTVVLVGLAWMFVLRRWRILLRPSTLVIAFACALVLVPVFYVLYLWGFRQFEQVPGPSGRDFHLGRSLSYYAIRLVVGMAGSAILVAAAGGLLVGLARPRWRPETFLVLLWLVIPYVVLSFLWAKDERYLFIACPALVRLIAIGAVSVSEWLTRFGWSQLGRLAFVSLLCGLAFTSISNSSRSSLRSVSRFEEVVAFMEQLAPSEPVLYEGNCEGVYTFHLRVRDPQFQRQVVLIRKWIPESAEESVNARAIGDKILASGCRWLVLEIPIPKPWRKTPRLEKLRDVVCREEFESVRVFPMPDGVLQRVEVYRIRTPVNESQSDQVVFDLPQNVLGRVVDPIRR